MRVRTSAAPANYGMPCSPGPPGRTARESSVRSRRLPSRAQEVTMTGHEILRLAAALPAIWIAGLVAGAAIQSTVAPQAASAPVEASPELVGALSKEIDATPEQAAGAAGTLFAVAKSR